MQGIKLLKKHGVEWNAMAVVNAYNVNHPLEFYRFFKENGCQFLQFTPIVERLTRHEDGRTLASLADKDEIPLSEASVAPEQWGYFLCAIFDEWVRRMWAKSSLRFSTAHWQTGWVFLPASVLIPRNAVMRE